MSDARQKLQKDLEVLEIMAWGMSGYLESETLFLPTAHADTPDITLGGYLLRQHRLLALRDSLLGGAEQQRLNQAVDRFRQAIAEKSTRFKTKAQHELEARGRQWEAYLRDLREEGMDNADFYSSAVETRAIIAALLVALQTRGITPDSTVIQQVEKHDRVLRQMWQPGAFAWPTEWQVAYPKDSYWWLYGQPAE